MKFPGGYIKKGGYNNLYNLSSCTQTLLQRIHLFGDITNKCEDKLL